jgi:hypothetical protein
MQECGNLENGCAKKCAIAYNLAIDIHGNQSITTQTIAQFEVKVRYRL